jgi:hypothetical protein
MPGAEPMTVTNLASKFAAAKEGSTLVLPPGRISVRAPLILEKSVRVRGAPDGTTVLEGGNASGIFLLLGNGHKYTFETLTFQSAAGRLGGAITAPNRNTVSFEGCRFADNRTEIGGAAGVFHHARGFFRRCVFERNTSMCGGALGVGKDCDLTIDRCVFVDNKAEAGGAIFLDDSAALEIRNSTFLRNVASRAECGHAMYAFGNPQDGPSSFIANSIFAEEDGLSSDPGPGMVFLTHSVVPPGVFKRKGFKDVGSNMAGPVELVDLGGGAWALTPTSAHVGIADVNRIEPGAVDMRGARLIQAGPQGSRASPGALAVA